jgi:hypothetical protein
MTGVLPKNEIDHRNRNKSDTRWDNLREATRSQNNANHPIHKHNTSGIKGVRKRTDTGKWTADLHRNNTKESLGSFENMEDAVNARREAFERLHGEFANHG